MSLNEPWYAVNKILSLLNNNIIINFIHSQFLVTTLREHNICILLLCITYYIHIRTKIVIFLEINFEFIFWSWDATSLIDLWNYKHEFKINFNCVKIK